MKERITRLIAWVTGLFPVRVFTHFGERNGPVLAAGMSYQALFAVFAAVYVGFSIAGIWLLGQPGAMDSLLAIVNSTIPGLVGDDGVITPDDLAAAGAASAGLLTWTGAIALIGLILTATGWISFARLSVRAVFGLPRETRNPALVMALDILVAIAVGVLLLVASVLSVASTAALDWVFGAIGLATESIGYVVLARVIGLVLVLAINTAVLVMLFRFLSSAAVGWRYLVRGALVGGAGMLVLQLASSLLASGASSNPLLATFAVLIGLLLFFRLLNTVILVAASWIAVGAEDRHEQLAPRASVVSDADDLVAARARVVEARRAYASAPLLRRRGAARRVRQAEDRLVDLVVDDTGTLAGVS
ncbi:membrane protein [Microbacteriaceae bacterium SG_E_30_P1]|uniref:Membrane protein n=1 Tax=Antiquaquibacter oligotrophicus TaxID=2880260 RepID=A0ABT6KMT3_9MICO|nr:YihY/virulence factor BrkB family protein [Antiquaquibacter oligotrophicus]MDH6181327.1 membrane protein [Antiquaquibacter oligotrophicus]UDF12980.1 YihY/virulence factor BrkB family protein [Antiquaquibacter oligotrophicus]